MLEGWSWEKSPPVLCRNLGQENALLCVKTIHAPAEAARGGNRMDPERPLVATMSNYTWTTQTQTVPSWLECFTYLRAGGSTLPPRRPTYFSKDDLWECMCLGSWGVLPNCVSTHVCECMNVNLVVYVRVCMLLPVIGHMCTRCQYARMRLWALVPRCASVCLHVLCIYWCGCLCLSACVLM